MKKTIKLETYLLFTNFFQGIFWLVAGIADCFKNVPDAVRICLLIGMASFVISDVFVIISKREAFDEFSQSLKQKTDADVLNHLTIMMVIIGMVGEVLSIFKISPSIPWNAVLKVSAGFALCAQYIVYIVTEKNLLADSEGDEDVQD